MLFGSLRKVWGHKLHARKHTDGSSIAQTRVQFRVKVRGVVFLALEFRGWGRGLGLAFKGPWEWGSRFRVGVEAFWLQSGYVPTWEHILQ